MKKGKSRWKLDFEIGLGLAVILLVASVGFAAAATVKAKPKAAKFKNSLPKAAPRKVTTPVRKPLPKAVIKPAPAPARKESPASSGIPVLTAPAPTPEAGFSSEF